LNLLNLRRTFVPMNWINPPVRENQPGSRGPASEAADSTSTPNRVFELSGSPQSRAPAQNTAAAPGTVQKSASDAIHFHVQVDLRGQVHIHCLEGKKTLATVGFTVAGFNSLQEQGLMRKPKALSIGALHDWVEIDGELCSFEKGRNEAARLEQLLNERYLPEANLGHGKSVTFFYNVASATGFDIQFPCRVEGTLASHRYHLSQESLDLLQDPDHCGLLHKEIMVKLMPPDLVFKKKTHDGGEEYLLRSPDNEVELTDVFGSRKTLPLSDPLSLMHLTPAELAAIFNHPAINRYAKAATMTSRPVSASEPRPQPVATSSIPLPESKTVRATPVVMPPRAEFTPKIAPAGLPTTQPAAGPESPPAALPNLWLTEILARPALRPDWFARLAYSRMAMHFGNSSEGKFGPVTCWFICLGEADHLEDPNFKGIFLSEKGSLGFFGEGQIARFSNRVAFLGTRQETHEGIQVNLVAVGLDSHERLVFIVSNDYRDKFGIPEVTLSEVMNRLKVQGAVILSMAETLASHEPITLVWTVPAEQTNPTDPQVVEITQP
jgi:hypothetical protein